MKTMKATEFMKYLEQQAEIMTDMVLSIEHGELDGGVSMFHLDLDKLNRFENGDFDLENDLPLDNEQSEDKMKD